MLAYGDRHVIGEVIKEKIMPKSTSHFIADSFIFAFTDKLVVPTLDIGFKVLKLAVFSIAAPAYQLAKGIGKMSGHDVNINGLRDYVERKTGYRFDGSHMKEAEAERVGVVAPKNVKSVKLPGKELCAPPLTVFQQINRNKTIVINGVEKG